MRKLLIILVILAAAGAALYASFDSILMLYFARAHNLEISYKKQGGLFVFKDLNVTDKKTGLGLSANDAVFKPVLNKVLSVNFALKSVRFIKKAAEKKPGSYDTLTALVATPFEGRWLYKKISGVIIPVKGGVKIKDLMAESDAIRLSFNGEIYDNNDVNSDIMIYFSARALDKVPGELTGVILSEEKDDWKSLSVRLEGNYKKPSIQVSSKRFRLNIKSIVDSKR